MERRTVRRVMNNGEVTSLSYSVKSVYDEARTNDTTVKALAGVASPLNDVACVVSLLNLASLSADAAGSRAATAKAKKNPVPLSVSRLRTMAPGAMPKVTISARLSRSFPMSEYAFSRRAANPSEKSNSIPAIMQKAA